MKKIFTLFDYIYYRFNNFYKKWDGEHAITAVIAVSALQFNIIFIFYVIVTKFFFRRDEIQNILDIKIDVIVLMLLLLVINYFYYKRKSEKINKKWKNESKKNKRIKGWGIIAIMILSYILIDISINCL